MTTPDPTPDAPGRTGPSAERRRALTRQLENWPDHVRLRAGRLDAMAPTPRLTRAGRRLRAEVTGADRTTNTVDVWFDPEGRIAETVCDCWAGNRCIHAFRALTAWMGGADTAVAEGAALDPLASGEPAEVHDWAAARDALPLLDWEAAGVLRRHGGLGRTLRLRSGDSVAVALARRDPRSEWTVGLRHRLAEALRGAVREMKAARAHAQAAEAWRGEAPDEPALERLWRAVRDARAERDALAPPTLLPHTNSGRLTLEDDPPGLAWVSTTRPACQGGGNVRMALSWHDTHGLRVTCGCPGGPGRSCTPKTDLLDRACDLLTAESMRAPRARLQAALAVPSWSRDLDALDVVLGEVGVTDAGDPEGAPDPEGRRPGWRLTPATQGGWSLQPVWTRPYLRRTGLRTWKRDWRDVEAGAASLPAADRALLHALDRFGGHGEHVGAGPEAFAALVGHPRVVRADGAVVEVDAASLALRWSPLADGGVEITPVLAGRGRPLGSTARDRLHRLPASAALVDVCAEEGRATLVHASHAARSLVARLMDRGGRFPGAAVDGLWARLDALTAVMPVEIDPALRGSEVPADLQPIVRLTPAPTGSLEVVSGTRPLSVGEPVAPDAGPDQPTALRAGERRTVLRDRAAEAAALAHALGDTLPAAAQAPWRARVEDPDAVLDLVRALQEAAEAGRVSVEWTRDPLRVTHRAAPRDLHLRVGSGQDWLALGGELAGDGWSVEVAEALAALRAGRRYVQVAGREWVRLSDALRTRLAALEARTLRDGRGRDRLLPLSGGVLSALEDAGCDVAVPETLRLQQRRIDEAEARAWPTPPGLQATLRPYQAEGVRWLQQRAHWSPGAVLADDMGLGKTLQALALLLHRSAAGPALVVAPTSVGFNWLSEAARFAPGLRAQAWRGKGRHAVLPTVGPGDVLVTSWDLLARDATALAGVRFATVVLDEAQAIKNPDTRRHRAARELDRGFTLALTGTPVENRTEDLWALFAVVVPGLLGARAWFQRAFGRDADAGRGEARARLGGLVQPFLLRRTKGAVAPELPARTEQVLRVDLSASERRLYDATRQAAVMAMDEDGGDNRFRVLTALTRLRQLACHPRLADPKSRVRSSKARALVELVDSLVDSGQRVLVFSQFTRHLDLAAGALSRHRQLRLQGDTPARTRARRVEAFQAGEADVFLISLKAGGTGLNLTAATAVVHLDPWWNPAAEDQATDRAHRIGQDQPVTVYRLVATNTVEDGILAMQDDKRALVTGVLADAGAHRTPDLAALRALLEG